MADETSALPTMSTTSPASSPPRFRVVLFDLDGTLIDSNALVVASFQHVFRTALGREVAAPAIVASRCRSSLRATRATRSTRPS